MMQPDDPDDRSMRRGVAVIGVVAAVTLSFVWLIGLRQWHPDVEGYQTTLLLIGPIVVFPILTGAAMARFLALEESESIPRVLKALGALATAGVLTAWFVIGISVDMPVGDPERVPFIVGGLVGFGAVGGLIAYGLLGAGSHLARKDRDGSAADAEI